MSAHPFDIVLLDMDGTIVRYESSSFHSSWDAIGEAAGMKEEWDKMLAYYYPRSNDAGTYREWFDANYRMLKGVSVQSVEKKIFPPPYTPGFREFCRYFTQQRIPIGVISSGVDLVAKRIQQEAGLDFAIANELRIEQGCFTGEGNLMVDLTSKGRIIESYLQEHGINRDKAAYFGDHENDIPAWKAVGHPFGINVKKANCYPEIQAYFSDFGPALAYVKRLFEAV